MFCFVLLFCLQVFLCIMCLQCLWGPEEGPGAPEIPVTDAGNHCAVADYLTSVLWKSIRLVLLTGSCFPAQLSISLLVLLHFLQYVCMNPWSQRGNSYVYKMWTIHYLNHSHFPSKSVKWECRGLCHRAFLKMKWTTMFFVCGTQYACKWHTVSHGNVSFFYSFFLPLLRAELWMLSVLSFQRNH